MKRKSILLTLLALLLCFPSCGKENVQESKETQPESQTETETETDSTRRYQANLPEKDYEGYKFRVLTPEGYTIITQFHAEEISGDSVNDAIYERNDRIGKQFNVTFEEQYAPNWAELTNRLKQTIKSDTDDLDLNMVIQREAFACALQSMILSADQLPYVDPTQPWYAHDLNDALTIRGKMYLVYSAECLNMYEQTMLVEFNKRILHDNNLEAPYELVRNHAWTYDKYFDMAEQCIADTNGDSKYTDEDILGMVSETDMFWPSLWVGCNMRTIEKDDTDFPVFTADTNERLMDLLSSFAHYRKIDGMTFDCFADKTKAYAGVKMEGNDSARMLSGMIFAGGHSAFRICHVGALKTQLDMEDDFGLLPCPLYNSDQPRYQSRVIDGWINIAPSNARNPERTSIILEALAAESQNLVIPAYYEKALKGRLTRDPDSKEMLDIVFETPTLDFGDTVWQGDIRNPINTMITNGNDQFASKLKSMGSRMNRIIQKQVPVEEE